MPEPEITIFHNPRCSKSRQALALLEERDATCAVVEYLRTPPDRVTLEAIVAGLDGPPAELVRTGDPAFAALEPAPDLSAPTAVVELLLAHPELLQRPVVVRGGRAVIGRPTERVTGLLD